MSLPAITIYPKLEKEDIRMLVAIELGMRRAESVPLEQIRFFSRMSLEKVQYHLDRVHKYNLVIRNSQKLVTYVINSIAYDILAIHTLAEQGFIAKWGPKLGVGKEADVYRALTAKDEEVAVKFFRLGRTSFRNVKKTRKYIANRGHYSWLYVSRLSAESEFEALQKVYGLTPHTPKPYAQNRHAIVMSIIQGQLLLDFPELSDPIGTFSQIITDIKIFYQQAGVIHGDLGEFNILLDNDENFLIIDFPQWVPATHPNAEEYLMRDITNVCNFFKKKHRVDSDPQAILDEILATQPPNK